MIQPSQCTIGDIIKFRDILSATLVDSGGGSVSVTNYGVINIVAGGNGG